MRSAESSQVERVGSEEMFFNAECLYRDNAPAKQWHVQLLSACHECPCCCSCSLSWMALTAKRGQSFAWQPLTGRLVGLGLVGCCCRAMRDRV